MTRRSLFGLLAGAAAVAADPERLLWTPGAKLISIPNPSVVVPVLRPDVFAVGDIITIEGFYTKLKDGRVVLREFIVGSQTPYRVQLFNSPLQLPYVDVSHVEHVAKVAI